MFRYTLFVIIIRVVIVAANETASLRLEPLTKLKIFEFTEMAELCGHLDSSKSKEEKLKKTALCKLETKSIDGEMYISASSICKCVGFDTNLLNNTKLPHDEINHTEYTDTPLYTTVSRSDVKTSSTNANDTLLSSAISTNIDLTTDSTFDTPYPIKLREVTLHDSTWNTTNYVDYTEELSDGTPYKETDLWLKDLKFNATTTDSTLATSYQNKTSEVVDVTLNTTIDTINDTEILSDKTSHHETVSKEVTLTTYQNNETSETFDVYNTTINTTKNTINYTDELNYTTLLNKTDLLSKGAISTTITAITDTTVDTSNENKTSTLFVLDHTTLITTNDTTNYGDGLSNETLHNEIDVWTKDETSKTNATIINTTVKIVFKTVPDDELSITNDEYMELGKTLLEKYATQNEISGIFTKDSEESHYSSFNPPDYGEDLEILKKTETVTSYENNIEWWTKHQSIQPYKVSKSTTDTNSDSEVTHKTLTSFSMNNDDDIRTKIIKEDGSGDGSNLVDDDDFNERTSDSKTDDTLNTSTDTTLSQMNNNIKYGELTPDSVTDDTLYTPKDTSLSQKNNNIRYGVIALIVFLLAVIAIVAHLWCHKRGSYNLHAADRRNIEMASK